MTGLVLIILCWTDASILGQMTKFVDHSLGNIVGGAVVGCQGEVRCMMTALCSHSATFKAVHAAPIRMLAAAATPSPRVHE